MAKITRREALKVFGAGAAGAALSPVFPAGERRVAHAPQTDSEVPVGEVLDVAIIGGGVSGLYTGWRLLGDDAGSSDVLKRLMAARDSRTLNVALFEMGTRLGGRLYSVPTNLAFKPLTPACTSHGG